MDNLGATAPPKLKIIQFYGAQRFLLDLDWLPLFSYKFGGKWLINCRGLYEVVIEHRTISSLQTIGLYIPCQLYVHDKNSVGVKVTDRLLKHRHQKNTQEKFTSYLNVTYNLKTRYSTRKQTKPCLQIWFSTRFVIALRDSLKDNSVPY